MQMRKVNCEKGYSLFSIFPTSYSHVKEISLRAWLGIKELDKGLIPHTHSIRCLTINDVLSRCHSLLGKCKNVNVKISVFSLSRNLQDYLTQSNSLYYNYPECV